MAVRGGLGRRRWCRSLRGRCRCELSLPLTPRRRNVAGVRPLPSDLRSLSPQSRSLPAELCALPAKLHPLGACRVSGRLHSAVAGRVGLGSRFCRVIAAGAEQRDDQKDGDCAYDPTFLSVRVHL